MNNQNSGSDKEFLFPISYLEKKQKKGQKYKIFQVILFFLYNYYLFVRWEALLPLRNYLSRMVNIDDGLYYRKQKRQENFIKTIAWLRFQVSN